MDQGMIAIILAVISLLGAGLTYLRGSRADKADHSIKKAEQGLHEIQLTLDVYKSLVADLDSRIKTIRVEAAECQRREEELGLLIGKSLNAQQSLLELCRPFFDKSNNGLLARAKELKEELDALRTRAQQIG